MQHLFNLIAALLAFVGIGGLFVVHVELFGRLVIWGSFLGALGYATWARARAPFLRWRDSYGAALLGGVLLPFGYGLVFGADDPIGVAAFALGFSLPISLIYATVLPFFDVARRIERAGEDEDLGEASL